MLAVLVWIVFGIMLVSSAVNWVVLFNKWPMIKRQGYPGWTIVGIISGLICLVVIFAAAVAL